MSDLRFIKNNFKKYRATKGIERNMYYKYQNQNEFNENLVSIQVALAKSKERTDETIMNEYTEKIILYGYILVNNKLKSLTYFENYILIF